MKQHVRYLLLLSLGFILSACAEGGPQSGLSIGKIQWPPTDYKHTVSTTAIRQYWNCTRPAPDVMRLDGLVANMWNNQPVGYLEWQFVGVDKDGHTVSSASAASQVLQLYTNQYTTYQIDLRTTGVEARFDLYYQYRFFEGDHNKLEASLDWDGPVLFAQQNKRWFVLDACSDSQHLAR